jgi:hypothetical protein
MNSARKICNEINELDWEKDYINWVKKEKVHPTSELAHPIDQIKLINGDLVFDNKIILSIEERDEVLSKMFYDMKSGFNGMVPKLEPNAANFGRTHFGRRFMRNIWV